MGLRGLAVLIGCVALLTIAYGAVPSTAAVSPNGSDPSYHPDPATKVPGGCDGRTPHPAIRVTEEEGAQGFTVTDPVTGETRHRPGSGVVAGDGSAGNPYVIEGWCIASSASSPFFKDPAPGILIEGTDSHVILRGNTVLGTAKLLGTDPLQEIGIGIQDASNITLTGNTVRGHGSIGIDVVSSEGLHIDDNDLSHNGLDGVSLIDSDGAVVTNNTATHNDRDGVYLEMTDEAWIAHNNLSDRGDGVAFVNSDGVVVLNNTARRNDRLLYRDTPSGFGIGAVDSDAAVVRENTVAKSSWRGFIYVGGSNLTVANNSIRETGTEEGLFLKNVENSSFTSNVVKANPLGIRVVGDVPGLEVHRNNIHANEGPGLNANDANDEVAATDNWWGCPDGPEDPTCDGVAGLAEFGPWLESPNPDAGPD